MLFQKQSEFTTLPSWYSGGKRCFQHDFLETELSGLPRKTKESCRKKLQISQSVSFGELWRGDMNRAMETSPPKIVINESSRSLELNRLRNPMREHGGEFLHPRSPQRAKSASPQRGIHPSGIPQNEAHDHIPLLCRDVTSGVGNYMRPHSNSTVQRKHSLSHLPSSPPTQPLVERVRRGLGLDLWMSFPESRQRKNELRNLLRGANCTPLGWSKEPRERNLELELSMMHFELLSLKQKQMQSSFAHLEKEKMWLKMTRCEDRKPNADLDDKMFHLETDMAKTRSYLGGRNFGTVFLDSSQNAKAKKTDVDQKLTTLQESSEALKKCIKVLEKERDEMAEKLKSAEEEQKITFCQLAEANQRATTSLQASQVLQKETGRLQAAYNCITLEKNHPSAKVIGLEEKMNELTLKRKPALSDRKQLLQEKVVLHQQVQELTPELVCAPKQQGMFSDQTLALHSELVSVQTQINHQEQEKVIMKEELESTMQVNQELSSEVAENCQRLGASSEKLLHLEAENKILNNCIQALENERTRLLGETESSPLEGQLGGRSRQEDMEALQESYDSLRESQSLLQSERDGLQTRCLELEAALQHKQEEMVHQLTQQQQVSQYWRGRWEEVTATLTTKEEELEKAHLQSQTPSAKVDTTLLLQIQLDACKQELELEKNRSQALHHQIQLLQSGSQNNATNETSLEEVDPELALVQEELQKTQDMLKARDVELEKQQLELESARSQFTECSSEKQRLEQLITSLEEEMVEKEQALRDLKQAKDMDRTELEVKISSLEQKIAEMEAMQSPPSPKPNKALQVLEGKKDGSTPGKESRSWPACSHCSAALLQLNQLIQSCAEKSSGKQEEEATLTYLYQVQELLKGKVQGENLASILGRRQTRKPDAEVRKTPQEEQESLKHQHQLVTEQLKGLFRQRKQLQEAGGKKQPGGPKTEDLVGTSKSQEVRAMLESTGLAKEGQPEALAAPGNGGEVQNLQQQLKEKTEMISSMASEIQALQEKNESLMRAKLRFQQQIQEIRELPKKRWPEKSKVELPVPKLPPSLGKDLQSAQWGDSSAPPPQSDGVASLSRSQEDLQVARQGSQHHPTAEDLQSILSSVPRAPCPPPTRSAGQEAASSAWPLPSQADLSGAAVPSITLSIDTRTSLQDPQSHADAEGALLSPGGSALLSPRPFGPQRPWAPFKFKSGPEPLEN
ncbi:hypothetical protein lerEdw1_008352 [Lerista edwardsae]|nr:hypothetical protein lerEdw1_008352 [Lerista edwardsae]